MIDIRQSITDIYTELTDFRRDANMNPGTAFEEDYISGKICEKLDKWGVTYEPNWAGTGIVATIKGGHSGPTTGLRVDIDALNVEDLSGMPWASKIPGKGHKCHHAAHAAIGLGVLHALSRNPSMLHGTVKAIFQPAEETMEGAKRLLQEGLEEKHPMDSIIIPHIWPELPIGTVAIHDGSVMASSDYAHIAFIGKGGHGAMPHKTINPLDMAHDFHSAVMKLRTQRLNPIEPGVINRTVMHAGQADQPNVVPVSAQAVYSIRTYSDDLRTQIAKEFDQIAQGVSLITGGDIKVDVKRCISPTINDPVQAQTLKKVAERILGSENVRWNPPPSMASEDASLYKNKVYFWAGQADPDKPTSSKGLHDPFGDYNDDATPYITELITSFIEEKLSLDAA